MQSSKSGDTKSSVGNGNALLKAGIIGAGRMGLTHLSILGGHPDVKVTAVCDDSSLISHSLSRYRPDINLYTDYRKMMAEQQLDMVLIATPPHLHTEMIQDALDGNLSVFVEKPFTLSALEAHRLLDKSRGRTGAYQVGYVNRFNDVFQKVKALLDQEVLGRLFSFRSDMYGRTVIRKDTGSNWRSKHETGGGCLYEFGSHAIDLVVYLLGKPDRVVGSILTPVFSAGVEDMVRSQFVYKNGLVGSLNVNWSDTSYRKPTNKIEILGEFGKILADQHELKIFLNREHLDFVAGWNTVYVTDLFKAVPFYVRGNEFTRQLFHFVEQIQHPELRGVSPFSDATATQDVLEMVIADSGMEF